MKRKLIAALIFVSLLLAGAIGVVIYMEHILPAMTQQEQPADQTTAAPESQPTQPVPSEETVGISLPTENPEDRAPVYDFPEGDETLPEQTVDPEATFDPDEDEAPRQEI